eukprot:scaffold264328_cov19-Tisochrysis_lutea.AAC.1
MERCIRGAFCNALASKSWGIFEAQHVIGLVSGKAILDFLGHAKGGTDSCGEGDRTFIPGQLVRGVKQRKGSTQGRTAVPAYEGSLAEAKGGTSIHHTISGAALCLWVRSRTFSENVNGEGITLMVPYADLANHSFSHNSTFCVGQSRQNFELRSVVHIGKGVEAAISY